MKHIKICETYKIYKKKKIYKIKNGDAESVEVFLPPPPSPETQQQIQRWNIQKCSASKKRASARFFEENIFGYFNS